jgi:hypothetical protein
MADLLGKPIYHCRFRDLLECHGMRIHSMGIYPLVILHIYGTWFIYR